MADVTKMTNEELADAVKWTAESSDKLFPKDVAECLEAARRLRALDEPVDVTGEYLTAKFEELSIKVSCGSLDVLFARMSDSSYKIQSTFTGYVGFVLGYKAAIEALGRKVKV